MGICETNPQPSRRGSLLGEEGACIRRPTPTRRIECHMAPSALTKLKRALKAAVAAGFPATRAEIEDGKTKIVLIFGGTDAQETSEPTPLDAWRASRGAR